MAPIISTIRLRDDQKQTEVYNHYSGPVIIVIIICHHINKCLLSADRINKNTPIIQMLITGSTQRGAELIYRRNRLRVRSQNQVLLLFREATFSA